MIDRDKPLPIKQERTLAEKFTYDIFCDSDESDDQEFYSLRYHYKRRHAPMNKTYGQYADRDDSDTLSSVDSNHLVKTYNRIDTQN